MTYQEVMQIIEMKTKNINDAQSLIDSITEKGGQE